MYPVERYEQNERLVYYTLHKYFPDIAADEDWQQIAKIALWFACKGYDETSTAAFSTYAVKCIWNHVGHRLGRLSARTTFNDSAISLSEPVFRDTDGTLEKLLPDKHDGIGDFIRGEDARQAVGEVYKTCSPRQREILDTLVACDFNATQAGKILGVTPQAIRSRLSTIRVRVMKNKKVGDYYAAYRQG